MNDGLKKIIESSSFKVHDGEWVYAKVNKAPRLEDCFMASIDQDEITACFKKEDEEKFDILEKNKDLRKLIEIKVSAPFYAVGFLAAVTGAISAKGCNNLVVSTYSKDYVLVTLKHFQKAKEALTELGFKEEKRYG